nr:hypothetical protein [Enterocloster clostridioformis]
MENIENCQELIWRMAEKGQRENEDIQRLMSGEFLSMAEGMSYEEDKILKLRKKTATLIKEIQDADKIVNKRAAGTKSFYK